MAKTTIKNPQNNPAVPKSHTQATATTGHNNTTSRYNQPAIPGSTQGGQKVNKRV